MIRHPNVVNSSDHTGESKQLSPCKMECNAKEVGLPTMSIEGTGTATLVAIRIRLFYYTESTNGRRSARPTALLSTDIEEVPADSNLSGATQWLSYSVCDRGMEAVQTESMMSPKPAALPKYQPKRDLSSNGSHPKVVSGPLFPFSS